MQQNLSPMMQQYMAVKEQHKNELLFFRLGDFYEMFFEDALIASKELELTLTGRDCGLAERAPMCGVPHHSCEIYIKRLIEKGYKVAICEQMEDPALAKGIVSREVIRVITPGTLTNSDMLDESRNNYICSVYLQDKSFGISFADVSTGDVFVSEFTGRNVTADLINELARYAPSELLFNSAFLELKEVGRFLKEKLKCTAELMEEEKYAEQAAEQIVLKHFGAESLAALKLEAKPLAVRSLGAVLSYISETQKEGAKRIVNITFYNEEQFMSLDVTARRNLELTETMRGGEKKGSLLWVLDKTKTAMGKRLLRKWIEQPLVSLPQITRRQNAVAQLVNQNMIREELREELAFIYDLERLMTKVIYGSVNPRELKALSFTASHLPAIRSLLSGLNAALLQELNGRIDTMDEIREVIDRAIIEEPPVTMKEGGAIAPGFHAELDSYRDISKNGKQYILKMEEKEREKTGIKNLKIGYNRVFGYYIEVTKSNLDLVPPEYIRKQTLANCERFITEELKEYEEKVLVATEKCLQLELTLFDELKTFVGSK